MWIVRLALRRPYTFTVMAILIVLVGTVTISRISTDIFPNIDIPVVSVIWSYAGVAPEEMEKRFVTVCERAMTTTVNDIEHIESQSYNGVSVIKVFFHEGAKVEAGVAQVTSITQTLLRILPPGTTPPLILQYSASNVPILQLGLTSKTLSEQDLYDLGLNSRCRASSRRVRRANEHRRAKSRALGAAHGFEKRERVHARYHQPGESGAAADQGDLAARARNHAIVRSIDLCPRRHQRRFE